MATVLPSVSFDTTLTGIGNNTGIVVPVQALAKLGGSKRPPVRVEINGYGYLSTVGVMAGRSLISVSAAIRKSTGLAAGDPIHVTLTLNDTPREVEVPNDFANAMDANPEAATFFANLSNSLRRYHVDKITSAKSPETRQRRVNVTIQLFLEGKKR